jgi:tetratricopeptide (TPR) repeat protein
MNGMQKKRIEKIAGLVCVAFLLCSGTIAAQKAERQNVREGNKEYKKEKFTEAEIAYRKSIEVNPRSTEGIFNLGNSLYKQEKYPEAMEQYQLIAGQGERMIREDQQNAERLAQLFHNMGNIGMKSKEYQQSVEAYKQSLRLNPSDDETRYNLALAQKLLEQQQQQQDQDQNQDQNEDKQQDQEQKQDQQDQQDQQQQQDQQDKEQKTQEEQQQNEQMSRDNAQQILDAFLQDEKDTQEKVKKAQMQQQQNRRREKQW